MSGTFLVQPVTIPQAAALDYAGGDVRHVSPTTDAMDAGTLSRSTRELAFRDVKLAEKLNELIQVVNNKDQFINLPLPTTTLPGGASQVLSNYRIPPGFNARILNAKVSSSTIGAIQLDIGYNSSVYGMTNADVTPVSTLDEFSVGTSFYGTGEFVVTLTNISGKTATATASILLTMQPVVTLKGGIISPGAVGPQGPTGATGSQGDQGNPGVPGVPGPIGINWRGTWAGTNSFSTRDGTQYNGSSWFAKIPNVNVPPPTDPTIPSATWDLAAQAGTQGSQGPQGNQGSTGLQGFQGTQGNQGFQGTQGFQGGGGAAGSQGQGFNFRGTYNGAGSYAPYDVVTVSNGTVFQTYSTIVNVSAGNAPPSASWFPLVGPNGGVSYDLTNPVTATTTGGDYVAGSSASIYGSIPPGSNYATVGWTETSTRGSIVNAFQRMSVLRATSRSVFKGSLTVNLPQTADGAKIPWTGADVSVQVSQHGTISSVGTLAPTVEVTAADPSATFFTVVSHAASPAQVQISVFGNKIYPYPS